MVDSPVDTVAAPEAPVAPVPSETPETTLSEEQIAALAEGTAPAEGALAAETPAPLSTDAEIRATPTTPVPPVEEKGPTAAELRQVAVAFQQREQQLQAEIARHQEEAAQLRSAAEERQYKADLEGAGYTPEQVKEQVGHLRDYQATTAANAKERAQLAQMRNYLETTIQNSARNQVMVHLSQKYGVPVAALTQFNDAYVMEAQARAMKAEAELAKMKQATVPVQRFAGGGASLTGGSSDSALLDQYNQGVRTDATRDAARRAAGG